MSHGPSLANWVAPSPASLRRAVLPAVLVCIMAAVIAVCTVDVARAQTPAVFALAVEAQTPSSALATVTVTGAGSIHLRYLLEGTTDWTTLDAITAMASDTEVDFTLAGLTANAVYEVEASQDASFPATDATVSVTFENRPTHEEWVLASDNNSPNGIWGNADTVWVANGEAINRSKLLAYNRTGWVPTPDLDLDTTGGNLSVRGIWSDGETMYVVDRIANKVFAYDMSSGQQLPSLEATLFQAAVGLNIDAWGIWGDANTLWVGAGYNDRVYAYRRTPSHRHGDPDRDEEFGLEATGNADPLGIWSDGTTLWIVRQQDQSIYAYDIISKVRRPA